MVEINLIILTNLAKLATFFNYFLIYFLQLRAKIVHIVMFEKCQIYFIYIEYTGGKGHLTNLM